tara:strand:+ start:351 stop:950 length:600 start_codon:yes stop_codon:yes gene_type:complete
MSNQDAYLQHFKSLLPPGAAFNQQSGTALADILSVFAAEFSKIDKRSQALIREADPRTTIELLMEWENEAGLPDPCSGADATLQERKEALLQRLTSRGGQSKAFFISVAKTMGYEITITEFRPFIGGISAGGDAAWADGHKVRFYWRVNISEAKKVYFIGGRSTGGDKQLAIRRAADLECILQRLKPAHTMLLINYEGV